MKTRQPGCKILGFSPDDMYQRHNQSPQFRRHLPLYDFFFTTKTFGVAELHSIGCPRVAFQQNGYDPDTHRPLTLSDDERASYGGSVGFVGSGKRSRRVDCASRQRRIPVRVWGQRWASECKRIRTCASNRASCSASTARALNSFDINLCFLRKLNRDRQTTRSVDSACARSCSPSAPTSIWRCSRKVLKPSSSRRTTSCSTRRATTSRIPTSGGAWRALDRALPHRRYSYPERLLDMLTTAGVMPGGKRLDGN